MAFKLKSPLNAYVDNSDTTNLKQVGHSNSYTGPKNMITAGGISTQLTQDDKKTTMGGNDPFSGYSKDTFKKKKTEVDDTPVPTDAEMKNTFDQFLFDNKGELDKLEQDAQKRKQPFYPSEQVERRTWDSMRPGKDQLIDIDKYRNSPVKMKKKQLTKTGAGKAHNMSALQYNQEELMSSLSGASDQPSQSDLDAMKALINLQNNDSMSTTPLNFKSYSDQRTRQMEGLNDSLEKLGESQANSPMNLKGLGDDNREIRKMKRAAKKEDRAKMKAKRKEGTLDSSDFAQQPYRTLKGKF